MPGANLKWERLKKAAKRARIDLQELIDKCKLGECQFWDNDQCSAITCIQVSNCDKVCYIIVAGGTLKGLRALDAEIEQFARDNGCQAVRTHGRLGFKSLEGNSQGFKPVATLYEKELR